jgi:hypothetical protein
LLVAEIFYFNIVHDDEMVERRDDFLHLAAISLDQKGFPHVEDVHVAENAALRVQQERINTMSRGEIPDIIGDHAIHPAHPVAAR